jgi:thiamine biosynthesis lipoprotein
VDAALSGSGTAVQGAHLIDPRAGRAAARIHRVWALAPSATQSDALSTAFFVMSEEEIARFCGDHPQVGAAYVDARGGLQAHGALAPLLQTAARP